MTYAELYGNTEYNQRRGALVTFLNNPLHASYLFLFTLMQDQIAFFPPMNILLKRAVYKEKGLKALKDRGAIHPSNARRQKHNVKT